MVLVCPETNGIGLAAESEWDWEMKDIGQGLPLLCLEVFSNKK